jgi:hypothetical protein
MDAGDDKSRSRLLGFKGLGRQNDCDTLVEVFGTYPMANTLGLLVVPCGWYTRMSLLRSTMPTPI